MNLVNARWHWVIALNDATPAGGEELRIFCTLHYVARSNEFISARAEAVSNPSGSGTINVWTGSVSHHGTQNISREIGSSGGLACAKVFFLQKSRAPIPSQDQKNSNQQRGGDGVDAES